MSAQNAIAHFLHGCLAQQLSAQALAWVEQKTAQLQHTFTNQGLYMAFAAAPRFVGKEKMHFDAEALAEADRLRPGFSPALWTADQTARALLLLQIPAESEYSYVHLLDRLFETAEVNELVALYSSLPLLAFPAAHAKRAAEGVRTNMTVVFEAIALHNPYPAEQLDENAWNQLFLKAIFTARPIYKIVGVEKRANATLARMLSDYAHERWAAGRVVSPELWRPIAPFVSEALLPDLQKLFASPDLIQQEAAALVCAHSTLPAAQNLLAQHPDLAERIAQGQLTWAHVAQRWNA